MAKEGSTIGGLMDAFGTAVSMSLQYGVPLEVLRAASSPTCGSSRRATPRTRTSASPRASIDYIFRWLGITFLPGYKRGPASACIDKPQVPTDEDDVDSQLGPPP